MAKWLEPRNCILETLCSSLIPTARFVLSSSKFKSSTTFVNIQLVYIWPVGILNPIMFDLNYLFQAFA